MREEKEKKPNWSRERQESNSGSRYFGYHLGYNLGFESGFEKGYAEGGTLGYNNGFLTALRLVEEAGEDESALVTRAPSNGAYQIIRKLVEGGRMRISLSGSAALEAETLFRLLKIEVQVTEEGDGNCP